MKNSLLMALAVCFLLFAVAEAQTMKKIIKSGSGDGKEVIINGEGGEFFDIPELAVFISQSGDNLAVTNVMDVEARPKGYENIDIQLEDIVLMANGKRLAKLEDFESMYKEAKPGTTIKLGIKRGDKMMMTSFDKADPDKLPKHKMVIQKSGGDGEVNFLGIPSVGLVLGTKGKKIVVTEVFDDAKEQLQGADVKEGDEVKKVNGTEIKSFKDLSKTYRDLKVGDKVEIVTSRSGASHTITFKKPEEKGGMKIIRRSVGN